MYALAFQTRVRLAGLKRIASGMLRPTLWVTAERAFSEFFFLVLFAVQAPLLGPSAFGLIAAVMVFVAFWEGVPGHAITEALLSIRKIDDLHYSTATTISVLLCLVIGCVVVALAGPLAASFHNPELVPVMRVMSVLPLIQAFSVAPLAAAQREMRFKSTTLRTILSLLAGGVTGLALALNGAGVWALVWQALVQRFVAVVVLWMAVPLRLGVAVGIPQLRELAAFAMPAMLSRMMGWISGQLPRLILGFFLGPAELGLYGIATRLSAIVSQVAIGPKAAVARIHLRHFTEDPAAMRRSVREIFMQLSLISFPVCIGGAAVTPALFYTWLDQRWYGAILPSQLMLLSSAPYVTYYGATAILYAMNRPKSEAICATVLSLSVVSAVIAGSMFGLVATAAATLAVTLAIVPLPLVIVRRTCGLTIRDVIMPQIPPLAAATVMGAAVSLLGARLSPFHSSATVLAAMIASGCVIYTALMAVLLPAMSRRAITWLGKLR